ncbi:23 kDa integral membrane protein [Bactrocera tryoni]|uniref:23 kDa integral membrane protein n=1 Tax=Bactrocera tryoni TaxID=59916 RepID=UPI001A97AD79|nr:23 kDa integral membrane protein [Bactrocera tryoni]XP_039956422.1 23 kDa integral membrane protein [Bactrocera tryoni]XP_039956424.1 23 kDa integral membrane protein [Bactrocera tryoni]XP_039956425.1 23 kDa integral membrane protein [Bactrocera tryoni]XP_039956426.1 23 kDa integral membrane protein [Bactrocera tryoni]
MTSTSTIKKFTIVFGFICSLLALVLIAFGIYVLSSYRVNEVGSLAAYAYICLGVATILVSLLGFVGAARESVCCTITFITFLLILLICQIAITLLLVKGEQTVASHLSNNLDVAWEEELNSPGAMSLYETWLGCCGRASPHDYIVNDRMPPMTCFKNGDNTKSENLIGTGCRIMFENYWLSLLRAFNIIACVMIGLELLVSVISCCLCTSIRNDHRRSYY